MIAWFRRIIDRGPAPCTWTFASGHPLLSICPNCGRSGGEHRRSQPGDPTVPGVDWLTPMINKDGP